VITETTEVARALAVQVTERKAAVTRTGGALTGLYGEDYLAVLRHDWPQ